ncbi:MAG TPA: hypothetical protein VM434_15830 [Beijerinckiaceae bacterium]|nr:hypothetical protein [Beijerinckiaceae bacterium]
MNEFPSSTQALPAESPSWLRATVGFVTSTALFIGSAVLIGSF